MIFPFRNNCPNVFQSIQKWICERVGCPILPSIMRYSTSMKPIQITFALKSAWMCADECRAIEFNEQQIPNNIRYAYTRIPTNTNTFTPAFTLITHRTVWLCVINSNGMEIYLGVDVCLCFFPIHSIQNKNRNNYILSRISRHIFLWTWDAIREVYL